MAGHRALIIGCGRMGAGRDHISPMLYSHIDAYRALKARVEVVGFVDRVLARAEWAAARHEVPFAGDHIVGALDRLQPDVVSICTPPSDRAEVVEACDAAGVPGIWCEKPFWLAAAPEAKTQVNYIRRFDSRHQEIHARRAGATPAPASLFVFAPNDIHTTCHFTDLADWWHIPRYHLHYIPFHGPSLYILREMGPTAGRYSGWKDDAFVGGGVVTGFMEAALSNLLDALDDTANLVSPAAGAIESERWARAIIAGGSDRPMRGAPAA